MKIAILHFFSCIAPYNRTLVLPFLKDQTTLRTISPPRSVDEVILRRPRQNPALPRLLMRFPMYRAVVWASWWEHPWNSESGDGRSTEGVVVHFSSGTSPSRNTRWIAGICQTWGFKPPSDVDEMGRVVAWCLGFYLAECLGKDKGLLWSLLFKGVIVSQCRQLACMWDMDETVLFWKKKVKHVRKDRKGLIPAQPRFSLKPRFAGRPRQ